MELFDAYKQVNTQLASDACAHEVFYKAGLYNGSKYNAGMLHAGENIQFPIIIFITGEVTGETSKKNKL